MPWICKECNSFNEDDRTRECCVCGALRSIKDMRKEKIEIIMSKINKFGPLPVFIGVCLSAFILALLLVLNIINGYFFTNIVSIFQVMTIKIESIINYFQGIEIGNKLNYIITNIVNIFSHVGIVFKSMGSYFASLFESNTALGSIGPFFIEVFHHMVVHFELLFESLRSIRWDKIEGIISYFREVIKKISEHFSSLSKVCSLKV